MRALLDSGASQTILGKHGLWVLEKFPTSVKKCPGKIVHTVDSNPHSVIGQVTLPITLEGKTKDIAVLVVPSLPFTLILGIDFWDRMQIIADVHNRRWDFGPKSNVNWCCALEGIKSNDKLSEEERQELLKLIETHFKNEPTVLGRTDKVKLSIDTGDAPPVKQRYYPLSPARQKLVNEELDKMLALGVIEPSTSPWSSPILLLDKPDGSHRFVVDFRKVNQVTKKDSYPLPIVTTILDRLRDARFLSSLDIKSAYWQIPLDEASKEKTAFTIANRGLFQFVTMPFGLSNAPGFWQRFVDSVLGQDLEPFVFVYLDDIIIVTQTFQQHIKVLKEIFKRLKEAKLTLNKDKCKFCRPELKYLGYIVSEKGLQVDPGKVKAIVDLPAPRNQKEVRQFCGTAGWYRRFILNYATRMYPLTVLLKKKTKFEWTREAQGAFDDIRMCLVNSPILSCPDFSKPFTIACDASGVGLGSVLSQETDKGEVVIAYGSRTLTKQEQNYSTTERECLSVIWAIERYRPYVDGTRFRVITDHYSLVWLNNLKDPQGRLARWALRVQAFDFELVHRKGKDNIVPDLLSRALPSKESENTENAICSVEVAENDIKDKWYLKMLKSVRENPTDYPKWKIEGGKLLRKIEEWRKPSPDSSDWKIVVAKELRPNVLRECHDEPLAGHMGSFKTFCRLQRLYFWPKMRQDAARYVSKCRTCQQIKREPGKPYGLMGEQRGVNTPWRMISADLIGPFPRSKKQNKYLLVVTDTFSKFSLLKPLKAATANLVSKFLEEEVFLVYGIPAYFICDNGSEFIGAPVKNLLKEYRVKLLLNASRHPQSNPTERVNQTIVTMMRAYVGENHRDWDCKIPQIGYALRTAVHETTGFTPAYLNFGRELIACGDGFEILRPEDHPPMESAENYGEKLRTLNQVYQEVHQKMKEAHDRGAQRYNLRRRGLEFKVKDLVWKRNFVQSDAVKFVSAKLSPKYVGPYVISRKLSPTVYVLGDQNGKDIGHWHVSDLKPYRGENV